VTRRLAVAVLALACAGWDTKGYPTVNGELHWTSMYYGPSDAAYTSLVFGADVDPAMLDSGNEHAELSHIAMLQLGWNLQLYADALPRVLDLNASVWNPQVRDAADALEADDNPDSPLIERRIPHPARFAGVADFSYTMYDWLNRNVLCPAVPESDPTSVDCHVYSEWLGAALNSSHFGEQPTKMYQRLHAIALALGAQAGALRATLVRNGLDAEVAPIEAMIREAELEALAYEGYAQHFLQDRWSSGHMWSRYGSPEYDPTRPLRAVQAVGLYSGLIHGAEALFSMVDPEDTWAPDALCSPQMEDNVGDDVAIPVSYFEGTDKVAAVGDYRLQDAYDGAFGAEYSYDDAPIDVHHQLENMMVCSRAGWADVARTFGPNPDGTHGVLGLPVDGQAMFDAAVTQATENDETIDCWGQWATNASMAIAMNDPLKPNLYKLLDRVASGTMSWEAGLAGRFIGVDFAAFGKVFLWTEHQGKLVPGGHDLADGTTLPPVMGSQQGSAYLDQVPASYTEPAPIDGEDPFAALPMVATGWDQPSAGDRAGRDRHTLQGYFHQAHATAWCEDAPTVLDYDPGKTFDDPAQGLRWPVPVTESLATPTGEVADELARRADACVVLADRLFSRTVAWYDQTSYLGPQRESRREGHGDTGVITVAPACETLEALPEGAAGSAWVDNPYELHPGYVTDGEAYVTQPFYGDRVYQSIVAWCRALPVVNVDDEDVVVDDSGTPLVVHPGFRDTGELGFDPDVRAPTIFLHGQNFGEAQGQVELESEAGCVGPTVSRFADIVSWTDTAIAIRVPHTRFIPDHYRITIIRPDRGPDGQRVRSVGRFRLDVQRAAFGDVGDTTAPLPTDVTGQLFAALYPYCAGGIVTSQRVHDCTGVDETACGADGGPGTLMWADGAPAGFIPGPFTAHQWGVQQSAICTALPSWVACMPQYPSSYGMIYRVERTSTAPVTAPPKRWRWTLIWERP